MSYALAWLFVCSTTLTPLVAAAGVVSFVTNLFVQEAEAEVRAFPINSQNIGLLAAAVNPDPNPAKGGGDISVVGGVALLAEAGPEGTLADIEETQSTTISIYIVREGDTLGAIAKMFGVTTNTIAWANDISRGIIRPGQTLIILPISGVRHTVIKNDTLQSIARKYKADLTEVAQYNHLTESAKLAIGDIVLVPDGEIAAPAPVSSGVRVTSPLRGAGGPNLEGYYLRPVIGGRKSQGLHGYNGLDIASYLGAPILAAASGDVIIAKSSGWNGGYGNYIVIAHRNGTQTLYGHLSALSVTPGAVVTRGQVIGYMGSTGRSTGSHLHFEVRGAKNPF
ncbi:MAG: M23 family metallopeptidase [bacterium]|nr:M23 family metallopeptidase [bacterium]